MIIYIQSMFVYNVFESATNVQLQVVLELFSTDLAVFEFQSKKHREIIVRRKLEIKNRLATTYERKKSHWYL